MPQIRQQEGMKHWSPPMEQVFHVLAKTAPWGITQGMYFYLPVLIRYFSSHYLNSWASPWFPWGTVVSEERKFFLLILCSKEIMWGIRQMQSVYIFSLKSLTYKNLTFLALLPVHSSLFLQCLKYQDLPQPSNSWCF